jgi:putative SOS response-associated peptidase YedK
MCGRYTIRELELLRAVLGTMDVADFDELVKNIDTAKYYNIAPSYECPIIRMNKDDKPTLGMVRWGLIPSWTKGKPKMQPINAKSETAATSGMFRQAMERRRCLVLADGFYEWKGAKPPKQPYFIRMKDDGVFAFAGLWERWKPDEQSEPIDTFTILTTTPNELMQSLHNRMPVILAKDDYARWLDRNNKAADVADLLKPFDAGKMEAWPVSTKVNTPKNQGADLIEKIPTETL